MSGYQRPRVGWVCSYTPEEIIHAAGFQPYRILPLEQDHSMMSGLLPPNLCPYALQIAGALEEGVYGELTGLVIANSCSAMLHLYNAISHMKSKKKDFFVYLMDLPRQSGPDSQQYFAGILQNFTEFLSSRNEKITAKKLAHSLEVYNKTTDLLADLSGSQMIFLPAMSPLAYYDLIADLATRPREAINAELELKLFNLTVKKTQKYKVEDASLILTGAPPSRPLIAMLEEVAPYPLLMENCLTARYLSERTHINEKQLFSLEDLFEQLSLDYLEKMACPRMMNDKRRLLYRRLIHLFEPRGIIFYDMGFCDMHHYDYLDLIYQDFKPRIPILKVSAEIGQKNLDQSQTRLEAFIEMLE